LAGLTHIPAVLRDDADQDVLVLSVIENLQRRGLSGPECVRALRLLAAQPGSSREIARRAGVNKLRVQLWRKIESQPLLLEAVETNRIPLWLACRCAYVKPERLPQVLSEVERLPTRLAEERVTAVLREQRDHRPARGMFKHSAAPPARGVEALLIEALELLRQVRLIRTSTELGLVRDVIKLAERWQASMKEATASRPTRWSCGSCGTEITTLPRAGKQVCPKCSSTWWTPVATRAVEARAI
jgi:ParB-like chromosome segregation protein Spo0J